MISTASAGAGSGYGSRGSSGMTTGAAKVGSPTMATSALLVSSAKMAGTPSSIASGPMVHVPSALRRLTRRSRASPEVPAALEFEGRLVLAGVDDIVVGIGLGRNVSLRQRQGQPLPTTETSKQRFRLITCRTTFHSDPKALQIQPKRVVSPLMMNPNRLGGNHPRQQSLKLPLQRLLV